MSVIFKEKHYDRLLIFAKNISIILMILIALFTVLNLVINNRLELLQNNLKLLQEEELKHLSLIKEIDNSQNEQQLKAEKYRLLIALADYAENLSFNSLHYKNKQIDLAAESSEQDNIFELIESLKKDNKFSEVNLKKISQKGSYYFQLETKTLQ